MLLPVIKIKLNKPLDFGIISKKVEPKFAYPYPCEKKIIISKPVE